jgi:hypothetical protein
MVDMNGGEIALVFERVPATIEAIVEARKVEVREAQIDSRELRIHREQELIRALVVVLMAFYLLRMLEELYECEAAQRQSTSSKRTTGPLIIYGGCETMGTWK